MSICSLENLSLRVVLFVFDNRTFSSLLLCLGTVLPLKDFERTWLYCIALYCTELDYLDWIILFPLTSTTTTYSQGIISTTTYYSNLPTQYDPSWLPTYLTWPDLTLPRHFLVSSTNATSHACEIDVVRFLFVSQNMFLVSSCKRDRYRYRA